MEQYLEHSIHSSLSLGLHENARFLAERLVAAAPSEQNKHLLATCYRHCNQGYRALQLLRGSSSESSRYLAALCCLDLRQYTEAESLLIGHGEALVPNGAAGWYLLGRISRLTSRRARAAECYVKALQQDPMLWVAFTELCMLGQPEQAAQFCDASQLAAVHERLAAQAQQQGTQGGQHQQQQWQDQHLQQPMDTSNGHQGPGADWPGAGVVPMSASPAAPASAVEGVTPAGPGAFAAGHTPHMLTFVTPSPTGAPAAPPAVQHKGQFPGFPEPPAGSRTPTLGKQKAAVGSSGVGSSVAGAGGGRGRKASRAAGRLFSADTSTPRRSARLAAAHGDTPMPLGRQDPNQMQHSPAPPGPHRRGSSGTSDGGYDAQENTPAWQSAQTPEQQQHQQLHSSSYLWQQFKPPAPPTLQQQQEDQLQALFLPLKLAHLYLSQYNCREALRVLGALPASQRCSAGVLLLIGRCLYELVDYARAAEAFEAARAADPLNLEDMELYSTVLWHLKRDVELAHLAQHCLATDRLSPQAWCVAGNCFSLQREHEAAVRLFQRALQLDPHMPYAASLAGHEQLANDDLAAATISYQHALRCDSRHYHAMYGLGQIMMKQEKFAEALGHFELGCTINPASSVLRCCCGLALNKMGRLEEAARQLRAAIALDAHNPLARFELAGVLMAQERLEEALRELQQLAGIVPREAAVHTMMGRLHKRLRNPDAALTSFNIALDLKPAAADRASIKSAIDKLHLAEEEEEEEL